MKRKSRGLLLGGIALLPLMVTIFTGFSSQINSTQESAASHPLIARLNDFAGGSDAIAPGSSECLFRDSPLYRSIFVYPSPGEPEWQGSILSAAGMSIQSFPWQEIDRRTKAKEEYHYRYRDFRATQYSTELLVREIITNPNSCLRSHDPETASLFYVPYLPSMEFHNGTQFPASYGTSPYSQAILDAINGKYSEWERLFGVTSNYWERRKGSDHILVFSEPCHGLTHPRGARGSYVYIHAQKQLSPPIVISVELSKAFATTYPMCSKKNIVMPYPNTDGRWYNGHVDEKAQEIGRNLSLHESPIKWDNDPIRSLPMYYSGGKHGSCTSLRTSLEQAFKCSPTMQYIRTKTALLPGKKYQYPHAYRHATFCPCPGGDTPSAKRFFDAILAGCIPIVLSEDYIWPFTEETPGSTVAQSLDPNEFSIRLKASDFTVDNPCQNYDKTLVKYIEGISTSEIERLRRGVSKAAKLYAYYKETQALPSNPMRDNILPNGGAAFALVEALAERAHGIRWLDCELELKSKGPDIATTFQC